MTFCLVIKTLDEFNALPFLTEIISIAGIIFAVASEIENAVVINRNPFETISGFPDPSAVV